MFKNTVPTTQNKKWDYMKAQAVNAVYENTSNRCLL